MDSERILDFIRQYRSFEDKELRELRDTAQGEGVPIIREDTEAFLLTVLAKAKPRRILELGTATGYSAILLAKAASRYYDPDGFVVIDTIEDWKPRVEAAGKNIKKSRLSDRINLIEGDAFTIMKDLKDPYDLIFIDAAKGQYPDYLNEAIRLSVEGSVIIADNIFQEGDLLESRYLVRRRDRTIHKRLREFLDDITNDDRLITSLIPVGDGITFSVRIK